MVCFLFLIVREFVVSVTVIIHRTLSHFLFTVQRIRGSGVGKEERRVKESGVRARLAGRTHSGIGLWHKDEMGRVTFLLWIWGNP